MQRKTLTHLAGLAYFIVVIAGVFSLMYVPKELINYENPTITVDNISNNLFLFRLDIVANMVCYLAFMVLPLLLFKVLTISLISITHKLDIIELLTDPVLANLFSKENQIVQVFFHLKQFNNGIDIVSIFWGLWLFPFGFLVFRSGFLPKILGILLIEGSVGYSINLFGEILIENYHGLGFSSYLSIPASLGEIGTCFWLLIMGDRKGFIK